MDNPLIKRIKKDVTEAFETRFWSEKTEDNNCGLPRWLLKEIFEKHASALLNRWNSKIEERPVVKSVLRRLKIKQDTKFWLRRMSSRTERLAPVYLDIFFQLGNDIDPLELVWITCPKAALGGSPMRCECTEVTAKEKRNTRAWYRKLGALDKRLCRTMLKKMYTFIHSEYGDEPVISGRVIGCRRVHWECHNVKEFVDITKANKKRRREEETPREECDDSPRTKVCRKLCDACLLDYDSACPNCETIFK